MEKTLEIDGKQVKFKSSGASPLRYKAQFGQDFFSDLMKMEKLIDKKTGQLNHDVLDLIDFDVLYNIIWVLAKNADKEIPEPIEWLDEFETFPIMEIMPELQELIQATLQSKKK